MGTGVKVALCPGLRRISEYPWNLIESSSTKAFFSVSEVYRVESSRDRTHNPNTQGSYIRGGDIHIYDAASHVCEKADTRVKISAEVTM